MSSKLFFLLLFVLYIHTAIPQSDSSSDSDSDSSDSQDTDIFLAFVLSFDILGSFRIVDSSATINVCIRSDGNIYMSSHNEFGIIDVVGRSTAGLIAVSDDIFKVTFDAYTFTDDSVGATNLNMTLTFNDDTGQYTLTSNGETVNLLRTEDESDPAACFMPAMQDYTIDFAMITVSEDFSDVCGFPCVVIEIFTNLHEGCWGFYDTEQSEFVGGGANSNNGILAWDGELRIADYTDTKDGCPDGTQFNVLSSEDTLLATAGDVCGRDFGVTFALSTECDAGNINICGMVLECPLFSSNGIAKRMRVGNSTRLRDLEVEAEEMSSTRLRDVEAEDAPISNGGLSEKIDIHLGTSSIANLWGIVIVFVSVNVALVLCWLNKRNKII